MRNLLKLATCLTPLCLTLAACSGSASSDAPKVPRYAAHLYVLSDVSKSSSLQGVDALGKAVRKRVADVVKEMELGDSVTVLTVGGRGSKNFVAYPTITTSTRLRLPAASRKVVAQLDEIARNHRASGGDGNTNVLLALDNLRPDCRSGRSMIMILSDGIESSEAYNAAAALNAGKPVEMPPPSGLLRGCMVELLGFGVVAEGAGSSNILPAVQLRLLQKGWEKWLTSAQVAPEDISFTSRL
jgi:hypothetical protein